MKLAFILAFTLFSQFILAQPFEEYQSFSGQYDYILVGNTLNSEENNTGTCTILTQSTATLNLDAGQTVIAAYLYWSGSGSGDFEVTLAGNPLTAERTFSYTLPSTSFEYFSAFVDVTTLVTTNGNGAYLLSNLNLVSDIQPYCQSNGGNATNYGGWTMVIIYEDGDLPFNDIRIHDGFVAVSASDPMVSITLDDPVIYSNTTATLGFLAWEGDSMVANGENLKINGTIISDPPLNPADNLFNGTNTFTGSSDLYNMDLDFFDISGLINETSDFLEIEMNTLQDLIIMNSIVTKVKDATATDTDDDLVFDAQEDLNGNRILEDDDTDGDTIANFMDDDDDGDGTLTRDEDYNNNGTPIDDDINGNNIPDYLDDAVFLGVNEFEINTISIVPNPVVDEIFIESSDNLNETYHVKVVSITGKVVVDFGEIMVKNNLSLNVTSINEGLYFLTFQQGTNKTTKKFLKL
ncbi:MAG: T9SS type A sorting domain-containing protein [Bacteroidota bacterium]